MPKMPTREPIEPQAERVLAHEIVMDLVSADNPNQLIPAEIAITRIAAALVKAKQEGLDADDAGIYRRITAPQPIAQAGEVCKPCRGKGFRLVNHANGVNAFMEKCPDCNGTGKAPVPPQADKCELWPHCQKHNPALAPPQRKADMINLDPAMSKMVDDNFEKLLWKDTPANSPGSAREALGILGLPEAEEIALYERAANESGEKMNAVLASAGGACMYLSPLEGGTCPIHGVQPCPPTPSAGEATPKPGDTVEVPGSNGPIRMKVVLLNEDGEQPGEPGYHGLYLEQVSGSRTMRLRLDAARNVKVIASPQLPTPEGFKATITEIIRKAVKYPGERVDPFLIEQITKAADERFEAAIGPDADEKKATNIWHAHHIRGANNRAKEARPRWYEGGKQ